MNTYADAKASFVYSGGLALLIWILAACGGSAGPTATQSAQTTPAAVLNISLLQPEQRQVGMLAVQVRDVQGQPVADAMVRLEGDMNHAGMIPVISDPVGH